MSFLSGVSKYIFSDLALGVVISIFASYIFAMTVVPLYCANFIHLDHHADSEAHEEKEKSFFRRFVARFNEHFQKLLNRYEALAKRVLQRPRFTAVVILGSIAVVLLVLFPFLGRAYFPRTDPASS